MAIDPTTIKAPLDPTLGNPVFALTSPDDPDHHDAIDRADSDAVGNLLLADPAATKKERSEQDVSDSFFGEGLFRFAAHARSFMGKIVSTVTDTVDQVYAHVTGHPHSPDPGVSLVHRHFTPAARLEVLQAIQRACKETGCPLETALRIVAIESSFNPNAQPIIKRRGEDGQIHEVEASSAAGLFQIINGTAQTLINDPAIAAQIAAGGGYNAFDPYQNALAGTRFTVKNIQDLTKFLGRAPSNGEIYLAQFLGEPGAERVLSRGPNADLNLSAAVLKANPNLSSMRTVADLVAWADHRMDRTDVAPLLAELNGVAPSPSSSLIAANAPQRRRRGGHDPRRQETRVAANRPVTTETYPGHHVVGPTPRATG